MTGMVFGKFMPLHKGHLSLIEFARQRCDYLYVVLCYTNNEPIAGEIRAKWLKKLVEHQNNISLIVYEYDETTLPNTSVSSRKVSERWAAAFKTILPAIDVLFTSENYGNYLSDFMGIHHIPFDYGRTITPVSATMIRENPISYWDYIADIAKPWFVKKISLVGTESTGKSVLAESLAKHFHTTFVPEMARSVIEKTSSCTINDLYKIAESQARAIEIGLQSANKLLFVDTDLATTQSYAKFLFGEELIVQPWIEEVNKFDLHLFLEPDCEYVQDGTRLSLEQRNTLSNHHRDYFTHAGIQFIPINGNWQDRLWQAQSLIEQFFFTQKSSNQN